MFTTISFSKHFNKVNLFYRVYRLNDIKIKVQALVDKIRFFQDLSFVQLKRQKAVQKDCFACKLLVLYHER